RSEPTRWPVPVRSATRTSSPSKSRPRRRILLQKLPGFLPLIDVQALVTVLVKVLENLPLFSHRSARTSRSTEPIESRSARWPKSVRRKGWRVLSRRRGGHWFHLSQHWREQRVRDRDRRNGVDRPGEKNGFVAYYPYNAAAARSCE